MNETIVETTLCSHERRSEGCVCVCVSMCVCARACTPGTETPSPRVRPQDLVDTGRGRSGGDLGGWGASPGRKALVTFLTPTALGQSWGLLGACGGMIPKPGFVYTWTWP